MHGFRPLRWLAFVLGLGVALAIAGAGVRSEPGLEVVGGWSSDGTCYWDEPNPPAPQGSSLTLVDVFPGCDTDYLIAGSDEEGLPIFACADQTPTKPLRHISSQLYSARGETLSHIDGVWTICPTGARLPEPEVITWWPESWYEETGRTSREDRIQLFRENYAKEIKLIHYDHRMRAMRHAAKGESLAILTRLLVAVPGREERVRIAIDPLFTAEGGVTYTDGETYEAVLLSDGGYHNADTFYMLFAQKSTESASEFSFLSISDIEGGYRGAFAVDVNSGEHLWTARTGVTCVRAHVADVNGDGQDEYVVQCYSSENGVSGSGTTDAGNSYVLCLDRSGNTLWKKRFVGVHIGATAAIADVTGDARPEVIVACSSGRDQDMGYAAILSGDGETLFERSDLGGLYGIAVADFMGTSKDQFVTGGPDGVTIMLDGELNVVSSHTDTVDYMAIPNWVSRTDTIPDIRQATVEQCFRRFVPFAAFDYDGDGDVETIGLWTAWANIAWRSHERNSYFAPRGDFVVFDSQMVEEGRSIVRREDWNLWRAPSDAPASLKTNMYPVDMDGDGVKEVVLSNGSRGLYVLKVTGDE